MPKQTAKDKLLDAGEALLLVDGYSQTSVEAVCDRAGVTKGSLYHYFKTKEDLGLAVLERWLLRNASILHDGPHLEESDPLKIVFSYLDHVENSVDKLWASGCLVGSLSMEMASASERMRQSVSEIFQGFVEQHADLFGPVLKKSKANNPPSATELAELFLAGIEGAIVVGKAYADSTPIRRAIKTFKTLFQALLDN